jgi:hypothetical protein
MNGTRYRNVQLNKPNPRKANITCFLSYVEGRGKNIMEVEEDLLRRRKGIRRGGRQ